MSTTPKELRYPEDKAFLVHSVSIEGFGDVSLALVKVKLITDEEASNADIARDLPRSLLSGHNCGYVRFSKQVLREPGYNGIVTYIPVHGGVTYAEKHSDGSVVYGFDCAHHNSGEDPRTRDENWLLGQCVMLAKSIVVAKHGGYEDSYLRIDRREKRTIKSRKWAKRRAAMNRVRHGCDKAKVINAFITDLKRSGITTNDNPCELGLGVLINLLGGRL